MYKQTFKTEALKAELERGLGFELKSLVRIRGGGAINFKAERASDGLSFLVKCYPPERYRDRDVLVANLEAVKGEKVPYRLFEETDGALFLRHRILCLSWMQGEFIHMSRLTNEQWKTLLKDYTFLSERMQTAKPMGELRPLRDWRTRALLACRGLSGLFVRPALEAMREDELEFRSERLRVIHGDFHLGNLLFEDGTVKCFMDLEAFRMGYPSEDILRYCMNSARKLKCMQRQERERVLSLFRTAVRQLPYAAQEWRTAINALSLMRFRSKSKGFKRMGIKGAFELRSHLRLDDLFRQQVDEVFHAKSKFDGEKKT